MSGYNLRALLEDAKFCSSLSGYNNSGSNQNMGKPAVLPNLLESHPQSMGPTKPYETGKFEEPVYNRATASLRNDVWGGADDFDLEYMDLDEFLNETGLVDTNFNSLAANNSPPSSNSIPSNSPPIVLPNISPTHQTMQQQQQQQPTSPHNSIEELLLRGSCAVNSPVPSISPVASPTSDRPTHDASIGQHSPVAESVSINSKAASPIAPVSDTVPANSTEIVKKRKYSEDGEGLTETSVVVVPGREGFDPSNVKFTPEDLQPQPIIKKSKKQFVAEDSKDEKYWKRRNKNNVAAKRSREARRAKENQIIMRAGFLETENERLNEENKQLTEENERLKELVKKLQRS